MALEAGVAWEVLRRGRRVCEVARRGPGSSYRVGKNKIVVKRRGVPDGLFQGAPWCRWRVFPRGVRGAAGGELASAVSAVRRSCLPYSCRVGEISGYPAPDRGSPVACIG